MGIVQVAVEVPDPWVRVDVVQVEETDPLILRVQVTVPVGPVPDPTTEAVNTRLPVAIPVGLVVLVTVTVGSCLTVRPVGAVAVVAAETSASPP